MFLFPAPFVFFFGANADFLLSFFFCNVLRIVPVLFLYLCVAFAACPLCLSVILKELADVGPPV